MSDMRHLLEKMNKFAGEKVGQKPGDQVRGSEPMPKKGGGKHPYAGRLVGASESSENLLKELTQVINSDPVKRDLFKEWQDFKLAEQAPTDKVRVIKDPDDPDNYDKIRFQKMRPDGSIVDIEPYSGPHRHYYTLVTGKEAGRSPQSQEMSNTLQNMFQKQHDATASPGKEFKAPQSPLQDIPVPLKQKSYEPDEDIVAEWGAAGTAVGPGNDDADPVEIAAQRAQQVAGKTDQQNQVMGLVAQVNGARSELANLNKQFPQGANPVEKAMSLQQQQAQKVQISRQIEDLMSQVAALRSQA